MPSSNVFGGRKFQVSSRLAAMEGAAEIYHAAPCTPLGNFTRFHDCKMATLFEEQQNRSLYYEYAQNHTKVKAPSIYEDVPYFSAPPTTIQPRLQAYEYQLWPNGDHVYDSHRVDYPKLCSEWNTQNVTLSKGSACIPRSESQRSLFRSRSKSSDRRGDSHQSVYEFGERHPASDISSVVHSPTRNRNFSGGTVREAKTYGSGWRSSSASSTPALCCSLSPVGRSRCEPIPSAWQQVPWLLRDGYCPVHAHPPPSPLDSGLSSQSVASSPSLEAETLPPRGISDCGSPLPLSTVQRNHCSCSMNSFTDSSALSPIVRSDSGRSSPWAQSAIQRLNALARGGSVHPLHHRSGNVEVPDPLLPDIDHRRYSMSGIYVSPQNRKSQRGSSESVDGGSRKFDHASKKHNGFVLGSCGYEYIDDFNPIQNGSLTCGRKSKHFKQLQVDTRNTVKRASICGLNSVLESEKSPEPESSVSLPASCSPTDLSSPTSNKSDHEIQRYRRSSKRGDKAICELEEMYNKLNLQDSDLLDRAERRDLPTEHQVTRLRDTCSTPALTRSKSDSFYEILGPNYCTPYRKSQRAPPARRSGIPDVVADDMAIRKWRKSYKTYQMNTQTGSYMLYSSHFTPSIPVPSDPFLTNVPDVEYDDLSYRRYYQTDGKADKPQPPFGIPLKPLPPQSVFSDYLHVIPSSFRQPLCHPRGNPDVVRDDLAFRTLRKDDPERAMYDSYSLYYRKLR